MLLQTTMDYQFSKNAFLVCYIFNELLNEQKSILPSIIRGKLDSIVDLDDPKVFTQHQNDKTIFLIRLCLWLWRIYLLSKTKICCNIFAFVVELIALSYKDSLKEIMFILNMRCLQC